MVVRWWKELRQHPDTRDCAQFWSKLRAFKKYQILEKKTDNSGYIQARLRWYPGRDPWWWQQRILLIPWQIRATAEVILYYILKVDILNIVGDSY